MSLDGLIVRLACTRWKPLTAYLKVSEVREKYFIKHKNELYATKNDQEIRDWYKKQDLVMYRLFRLYTKRS